MFCIAEPVETSMILTTPLVPPLPDRPMATAAIEPSGERSMSYVKSPPPTSADMEPWMLDRLLAQ